MREEPKRSVSTDWEADVEWPEFQERRGITHEVSLQTHKDTLRRHLAGLQVLEIRGAGFDLTPTLVESGNQVVICDLGTVPLVDLRRQLQESDTGEGVVGLVRLDPLRLSPPFCAGGFDALVFHAEPPQVGRQQLDRLLDELTVVLRRGGKLVLSLPSRLGRLRLTLATQVRTGEPLLAADEGPSNDSSGGLATTWGEVKRLLLSRGYEVAEASSANFLSCGNEEVLAGINGDQDRWESFLKTEAIASRAPGAVDGGTQILVVAVRA